MHIAAPFKTHAVRVELPPQAAEELLDVDTPGVVLIDHLLEARQVVHHGRIQTNPPLGWRLLDYLLDRGWRISYEFWNLHQAQSL
jgi:hypothetical protein